MPDRSLRLPPLLLRERRPSPTPPREDGDAPGTGPTPTGGRDTSGGDGSSGGRDSSGGHGSSDGRDGSGAGSAPGSDADHNPFAPPPEGTPDQPWQPRRPADGGRGEGSDEGSRSPWGSQWSDRQPGPSQNGGFGDRPGAPGGQGGPGDGREGGKGGPGTGMRWDPADPAQRRARYSLLTGMWAFFFALFSWPSVALLLGALAMYWGVSSVRAKPRAPEPGAPAPDPGVRSQTSAAVSGLVTASLALAMVALTFTAQLVYSDYYTCTNDALTSAAKQSCDDLLPKELRSLLGKN
ncbi:hypothetical protein ACFYP4_23590 [Streptomyces sp. NPDC005551]|uniref:hypothetical protein n=1 Tax=Streptomyces sp. NPDC005551 TaxID=3364725 RepID=UPI0036B29D55